MKRIVALALALLMLLASLPAGAEFEPEASPISTLKLTNLTVSTVGAKARTAKLKGMSLSFSLGRTAGVPTLQMSFDNGKEQQVDVVAQVVGNRLLLSMGGISGTYYVDLEAVCREAGEGARLARGMSGALALAGPHLDALLSALSTADAEGVRTLRLEIPGDVYGAVARSLLNIIGGLGFLGDKQAEDAEEYLEQTGDDLFLLIRYDPAAGALELDATQGGRGFGLKGDMALSVEDSLLVNISADEQQFDLMDLGAGKLLELRGELAIVALKFAHFAGGTGIGGLLK